MDIKHKKKLFFTTFNFGRRDTYNIENTSTRHEIAVATAVATAKRKELGGQLRLPEPIWSHHL